MTKNDWLDITYFKRTDNWGDPDLMDSKLIHLLQNFRMMAETPIVVSCGTQGKHAKNSAHPLGRAVDILFPEKNLSDIPELFIKATKLQFQGIGIYSHWKYNDKIIGGMHLDNQPRPTRAYWICHSDGQYIYDIKFDILKNYFS